MDPIIDSNNEIPPAPEERQVFDFADLIVMAKEVKESVELHGYFNDDMVHYMFEEVMKAVYGDDYFKWHNKVHN